VDPETLCESAVDLPNINPLRLERVLKETAEAAEAAGIELRLPDMPMSQILKYHDGGMDLNDFTCRGPWTNLYVGASGGVYPCFLKELGNVRESSLRGLWNGVEMRGFRKRLRDGVFCVCQGCCHLEHQGSGASCAHHRPQASA
jgi:MoaA/NifB/PqqE/SkfB family radical SAM enzyme